ncbi:MAG: energy transducer TonB, partial [Myxococcales bacterium]|nr:energy transducer TonB [Myxococcales bacterium]
KKPPKRPKPPKTPEAPKPPPEAPPPKPAAPPMLSGMNFEGASTAIKGPGVAINQGSTQGSRRGRPDGKGTGDPPPNPEADVVPAAGVSTLPVLVDEVKPEYPDDLKRAGVEGKVVLSLVVGVDGRVRSAKLVKRLHPELDRRAQQAAKRLRFKPAKADGTPVAVRIPYTFYFVID